MSELMCKSRDGISCYISDTGIIYYMKGEAKCSTPMEWKGDFNISYNFDLHQLNNLPRKIIGSFVCKGTMIEKLVTFPEEVYGDVALNYCTKLLSVRGLKMVGGSVFLNGCRKIANLYGLPKIINGDFDCSYCDSLTDLSGCSEAVTGDFIMSHCSHMTSLHGCPKEVGGSFNMNGCDEVTSLIGAPSGIKGGFDCSECSGLESLEGAPTSVDGVFKCRKCNGLKTLAGAPVELNSRFDCSECKGLVSLKGVARKVGGSFYCAKCPKLENLIGAPEIIGGGFNCKECRSLVSFEGCPMEINGGFKANRCINLVNLQNGPKKVHGGYYITGCKLISSLDGAPAIVDNDAHLIGIGDAVSDKEKEDYYVHIMRPTRAHVDANGYYKMIASKIHVPTKENFSGRISNIVTKSLGEVYLRYGSMSNFSKKIKFDPEDLFEEIDDCDTPKEYAEYVYKFILKCDDRKAIVAAISKGAHDIFANGCEDSDVLRGARLCLEVIRDSFTEYMP